MHPKCISGGSWTRRYLPSGAPLAVADHWAGILAFFESRTANGLLEGIHSPIRATKSKARGYRTVTALESIVYLMGSSLVFTLPTLYSE